MDVKDELKAEFVCRTCLSSECQQYRSLSSVVTISNHDAAEPELSTISDCLNYCLQSETLQSTELPQYICVECFSSLCSTYEFIKMAKHSAEKLLATSTQVQGEFDDVDMLEIQSNELGESGVKSEGVEVLWLKPIEQDEQTNSVELGNEEYIGLLEDNDDPVEVVQSVDEVDVAEYCADESNSMDDLSRYGTGKHKAQPTYLSCTLCRYKSTDGFALKRHYMRRHRVEPPQDVESKFRYMCEICEFETIYKTCLKRHYLSRHKIKPTTDQLTSRNFEECVILESFKKRKCFVSRNQKPNKCKICKFECLGRNNMKLHCKNQHGFDLDSEELEPCDNPTAEFPSHDSNVVKEFEVTDESKEDRELTVDDEPATVDNERASFECIEIELEETFNDDSSTCSAPISVKDEDRANYECSSLDSPHQYNNTNKVISYGCEICVYKTPFKQCLKRHYMNKHRKDLAAGQLAGKDLGAFKALKCTKRKKKRLLPYQCQLCTVEMNIRSNLMKHYRGKHKVEPTADQLRRRESDAAINTSICELCNREFQYSKNLQLHYKRRHKISAYLYMLQLIPQDGNEANTEQIRDENLPSDELDCQLCEYKAESNLNLDQHYAETHKILLTAEQVEQWKSTFAETIDKCCIHRCELCDKQFENSYFLECHMISHKDLKTISAAEFEADDTIEFIQYEPEDDASGKINEATSSFFNAISTKEKFNRILAFMVECEVKDATEKSQNEAETLKTIFQCDVCQLEFRTSYLLESHLVEHKGLKKLRCRICDYECAQPNNMSRHYKFKHDIIPTDDMIRREQDKEISDYSSTAPSPQGAASLPQQTNEQEPFDFICSKCSKGMRTLKAMKEHEKKCGKECPDERMFRCAKCSSRFIDHRSLRMHKLAVHNDRAHKCEICKKSFNTLQNLLSHKARHEKMRPFQCDQCTRSYIGKAELRVHQRVHTGELPFSCTMCPKRFRTADRLTVHREKIHLELTYKCAQCSEEFDTRYKLKLHLYKHNGIPYKCEVCLKDFIKRHQFRRHMEFVHATSISDEELAAMYLKNMKRCNPFDVFNLGIEATKIENKTNDEN